jgi:hypothetical protein
VEKHAPNRPRGVTAAEREEIKRRLDAEGVSWKERDHGVGVGLFFEDPDGRQLEAITYRGSDDPRRADA